MRRKLIKVTAFAIILDKQEQILLCHRRDIDLWNLPGGGVEWRETPWHAVVREVEEETGLTVKVIRLAGIYIHLRKGNIAFSYVCEVLKGKLRKNDEADDIRYFALEKIPRYTYPYHVARIRDVLNEPRRRYIRLEHGPSAKKLRRQGKM